MGKITSIITFTGKLGNVVGSKGLRGRHLIRARQYEVKNPRSNAQNVQRMIFATAATSLSYLTEILNNSFEGKAFGQESLSYARKVNLDLLRNMNPTSAASIGSYLKKGDKHFAPNSYILSQGVLVSPTVDIVDPLDCFFNVEDMAAPNATLTASQLFPNIEVGNQITIISVGQYDLSSRVSTDNIYTEVRYCRFAFKDDTTPALIAGTDAGTFAINPDAIDLVKAAGDWRKLYFQVVDGQNAISTYSLHSSAVDGTGICAAALLVSNLENNKRSTTRMAVARTTDWKWRGAEAYPTYGNVAAEQYDFASDVYLNNSARLAAAGGEQTVDVPNFPFAIAAEEQFNIDVPVPATPSEMRLTFIQNGDAVQSINLVGASSGTVLTPGDMDESLKVAVAGVYSNGAYRVEILNSEGGTATTVASGYAVVDGVRYTFS